ncbi:FG-GAP repeat protein [bacterium]|nr:FG-GAP repeat protein [bacterium]
MRVLKGAVFLLFLLVFAWLSASDDLFGSALQLTGDDKEKDRFGASVAVSGDLVAIGDLLYGTEYIYIFERNSGGIDNWGEIKKISVENASLALSGETLVVGGIIFDRNLGGENNWGEVTTLSETASTFALDGDIITAGTYDGYVYVFERNSGGENKWGLEYTFVTDSEISDYLSGVSLSVDGSRVVAGIPWDDHENGKVYIFVKTDKGWELEKTLTAPNINSTSPFGTSVSLSGNTLAVGSTFTTTSSTAFVFEKELGGSGGWELVEELVAEENETGDYFGTSVAVDGDRLAVGAPGNNDNSGAVYLFERTALGEKSWTEVQRFIPPANVWPPLRFGLSTAMNDGTLLVGAPKNGTSNGRAYLYFSEDREVDDGDKSDDEDQGDDNDIINLPDVSNDTSGCYLLFM